MPRRKTVKLNLSVVNPLIKQVFRSNVVFCEKMERAHNWVTDWNRKDKDGKPKPKNPPSPEEAAKMCILLETTPEVILLNKGATEAETAEFQADIALVRDLLDQQRTKKETPDPTIEGKRSTVSSFIRESTDASFLLDIMNEVAQKLKELEKKNGK